jgi:hypothetical protein
MRLLPELLLLVHVFIVMAWLGMDLVVFALSLSLINRQLPVIIRLERAHIAEKIDYWVLVAFVLTLPIGLLLARLKAWPLLDTPWLTLKLAFFGIITLIAVAILTGAAGTARTLKQIAAGAGDVEALEIRLRTNVIVMAPLALTIHLSILFMVFITLNQGLW